LVKSVLDVVLDKETLFKVFLESVETLEGIFKFDSY